MMNEMNRKIANDAITKDNILPFLRLLKNNINLSATNLLMAFMQNKESDHLCGRKAWEDLGFEVKDGSIPVVLFFPEIKKDTSDVEFDGEKPDVSYTVNYTPVNVFSRNQTTYSGDTEENKHIFTDNILLITQATVETIERSGLSSTADGMYDKENNTFFLADDLSPEDQETEMLKLYIAYVFDNYGLIDKVLRVATEYAVYEYFRIPHHIEAPLFVKLNNATPDYRVDFVIQLSYLVPEIIQDMAGYTLSFDETAFVNDFLDTSSTPDIWTEFDEIKDLVKDEILEGEINTLKRKLIRSRPGYLEDLLTRKKDKKLFTNPAYPLEFDNIDYLRKERNQLFSDNLLI